MSVAIAITITRLLRGYANCSVVIFVMVSRIKVSRVNVVAVLTFNPFKTYSTLVYDESFGPFTSIRNEDIFFRTGSSLMYQCKITKCNMSHMKKVKSRLISLV